MDSGASGETSLSVAKPESNKLAKTPNVNKAQPSHTSPFQMRSIVSVVARQADEMVGVLLEGRHGGPPHTKASKK